MAMRCACLQSCSRFRPSQPFGPRGPSTAMVLPLMLLAAHRHPAGRLAGTVAAAAAHLLQQSQAGASSEPQPSCETRICPGDTECAHVLVAPCMRSGVVTWASAESRSQPASTSGRVNPAAGGRPLSSLARQGVVRHEAQHYRVVAYPLPQYQASAKEKSCLKAATAMILK